jgi:hypothetical protein
VPSSGSLVVAIGGASLADAAAGAKLRARACVSGDGTDYSDSDWCLDQTVIDSLAPPAGLAAVTQNNAVQLGWQPVTGLSYAVDVAASAGTTLSGTLQTAMAAGGCTITGPALAAAPALKIGVRAYSSAKPGVWATLDPFPVVLLNAPPAPVQPLYRPDQQAITLDWSAPAGPSGLVYEARLTDITTTPAVPTIVTSQGLRASLAVPSDALSRRFTVAVRALFPNAQTPTAIGPWSGEVAVTPKAVAAVTDLQGQFTLPDQVVATWQAATPPAPAYQADLLDNGAVVATAASQVPTVTFKGTTSRPLPIGATYSVRVLAIDGTSASNPTLSAVGLPSLMAIAMSLHAGGSTAAQAAPVLAALPNANPAILLAAMVGAGWTAVEAQGALAPLFPAVTAAQWSVLVQDLAQPESLADGFHRQGADLATALPVLQALFPGSVCRLLVAIKTAGYAKSPLPGIATDVLDAVFDVPWNLGAELAGERVPAAPAAALVIAAYPKIPFVAVACSLTGGFYDLAGTGGTLRTALSVSATQFAQVAIALSDGGTGPGGPGRPLGILLRRAGMDPGTAAPYLKVAFPGLTDPEVQAALANPG